MKAKERGAGGLLFHRHDHLLANGIGDDLQRGDHVAILDQLVMLDAGKRDPLVDPVDLFQPLAVEAHDAPSDSINVHAAGCRLGQPQPRRHQRGGQPVGGGILVDIAGL